MKGARTYLDYNATAPLLPEARAAILHALEVAGNPSSVHAEGRAARALVEAAREEVASLVNAKPSEIVFTSGATEANATVLTAGWSTIYHSGIEHDSVLAPAIRSGACRVDISAGRDGVARIDEVGERVLKGDLEGDAPAGRALVALQMANNETGVVQPVADMAGFASEHGLFLHCDAVQAAGRIPVDFRRLGVSTMSVSAHKLGGPKGVGALVIREGLDIAPLICGGGQERRRRAGTENVAGIAGFGAAAAAARFGMEAFGRIRELRDRLEREAIAIAPGAVVIGGEAERVPNTAAIALPGRRAETMVIRLDLAGVAVSAGAACSSGKVGESRVLTAMGLPPEIARGTIRVSLGPQSGEADVDAFLAAWAQIARDRQIAA